MIGRNLRRGLGIAGLVALASCEEGGLPNPDYVLEESSGFLTRSSYVLHEHSMQGQFVHSLEQNDHVSGFWNQFKDHAIIRGQNGSYILQADGNWSSDVFAVSGGGERTGTVQRSRVGLFSRPFFQYNGNEDTVLRLDDEGSSSIRGYVIVKGQQRVGLLRSRGFTSIGKNIYDIQLNNDFDRALLPQLTLLMAIMDNYRDSEDSSES